MIAKNGTRFRYSLFLFRRIFYGTLISATQSLFLPPSRSTADSSCVRTPAHADVERPQDVYWEVLHRGRNDKLAPSLSLPTADLTTGTDTQRSIETSLEQSREGRIYAPLHICRCILPPPLHEQKYTTIYGSSRHMRNRLRENGRETKRER